ncbi:MULTISPECIES: hypothetical protein [Rhodococcus]|nr:hypothetical protein [Rhodococcus pyridinivorans]MCD2116468.1 hypothetical protein [Rhodococcus pyridinivorans]MCZ4625587.1 hypothetical protein [Rhodococcus pyridinivorans]MCZ4646797.1 hypothetical protein [Rhodococcus pyridinivorans]MDJ0482175.1 hypothetical protein [Rhodococcus pyridinivorans]MDV7252649.1 hypothetical protein [Rhodococcus pyridinivorans]
MQPPPDGYGYGYGAPPPPWPTPTPPRRPKWPWLVGGALLVAVVAAVAALVVVLTRSSDPGSESAVAASPPPSTVTVTVSPSAAPQTEADPPTPRAQTSRPATPSGFPTNGTLKVGVDITPGEYALRPTDSLGGYWERLSCLTGDFECITANSIVQGNSYVTVLPGDLALRIEDLELTATGNPAPATGPARPLPPVSASEDTDPQGFVGIPEARCNHTNPAVAIGQTADSLVVVCETGAGRYYYKGVRTNDGAAIEIDDPAPSGDGFTATNAGVQYSISSRALVISEGSTVLAEEPMLQYWSQ